MTTPFPGSALGVLRAQTRDLHADLEATLEVIPRLASPARRDPLIAAYRAMHGQAAALLEPWVRRIEGMVRFPCSASPPALDANGRLATPVLADPAEALGFYYVMQGAMLGGRVMLRELQGAGVDVTDLGFLNPHGDRAGQVWRGTVALLEQRLAGDDVALDSAVAGARKGYGFAFDCLQGGVAG